MVTGVQMNGKTQSDEQERRSGADEMPELELSDEDIIDAMQHIPGYIDITTEDFRQVYHLAHAHAVDRLFSGVRAGDLMRSGIEPLHPATRLDEAARILARQGRKGLPVVDDEGRVVAMLTETDFLRRLNAGTFLQLLLRLVEEGSDFSHCCRDSTVSDAMTTPVVTLSADAGFRDIVAAFHVHGGRTTPVVDVDGRLLGLLLRKDFVAAYHLEELI
jgi:CBS domain-containing membrane protein